ncbi:MAG: sugar O-acyltransferase, partial [Caedimonadaceae bacterium]
MSMKKKLIIIGDSAFAEVAFEYFTHDSQYEVKAFA